MPEKTTANIPPLNVHTLGYFGVWRGEIRVEEKAWGREKAREILGMTF